jgi:hypothetical protein
MLADLGAKDDSLTSLDVNHQAVPEPNDAPTHHCRGQRKLHELRSYG